MVSLRHLWMYKIRRIAARVPKGYNVHNGCRFFQSTQLQKEGTKMYSTAKEMMTPQVQSIGPEESIQAATEVLAKYNISGLPVVDENRRVVGIISSSDIVKFSDQSHIVTLVGSSGWISPYTDIAAMTSMNKGFELLGKKMVKDIMTRKVITVPQTATADEVARLLARKNINRLPVTDEKGVLVGIITRTDLIAAMAGGA